MFALRLVTGAVLPMLLSSCVAFPDTSEEAILASLRKDPIVVLCQSRVADLDAQLGPPMSDAPDHARRLLLWRTAGQPRFLRVLAQPDGVIVDSDRNHDADAPWVPVSHCA